MVETAVVNGTTSILESFGIVGGLFIILVLSIVFILVKYIPIAFEAHFNAIDKMQDKHSVNMGVMQDKFSNNLDNIQDKYLESIGTLGKEHEKQMEKMNDIHNDIKILHGINK